jgi:hypothetical protein
VQQNKAGEQKLFNQFGRFSLIAFVAFTSLNATDFEDFKRTQHAAFSKYKDANDNAFENYLKGQWREYNAYISQDMYKIPKPKHIMPQTQIPSSSVGPTIKLRIKTPKKQALIFLPNIAKKNVLKIDYFGVNLLFIQDSQIKIAKFYPTNQKGILNFFSVMASSDYKTMLLQMKKVCKVLNLNDWGLYLLVQDVASTYFVNDDDKKLFSWFMLNKMGYNTRVGLKNEHIILLNLVKQQIYAAPSYRFGGEKFYNLWVNTKDKKPIYSYKNNYPKATKALDFSLDTLPYLAKDIKKKTKIFSLENKSFSFTYHYNKNLIDFMKTYPQVDYKIYFNTPLEEETYQDIAHAMKPYIDGKKANIALNFVLHFVQKAFRYERDQEQFGKEKVMFAEETLYYDKSDCEDRATLYASLVKSLFGIGVVGVKYSNHMTTALYVPLKGDSVKVHGKRFVIADPTYINANVGQSMPKYKSIIPESYVYIKN